MKNALKSLRNSKDRKKPAKAQTQTIPTNMLNRLGKRPFVRQHGKRGRCLAHPKGAA